MERRPVAPAGQETRARTKPTRSERRAARKPLVAEHLHEISEQSFPNEEAELAKYDFPFIVLVKGNSPVNLDQALDFTKMWNNDPPFINRGVEKRVREAAIQTGRVVEPLKKRKFSSIKNTLEILGQGEIPTTSKAAAQKALEEDDYKKREKMEELRDQLWISEKTKGRHSSGFVIFAGGTYGTGLLSAGLNGGVVFEPRNPETKRREHDAYISIKGKAVVPGRGPVLGFRKHGIEKFYSLLGFTYSKGHPYRGEQARLKFPLVETSFGKLSGATHEAPLIFYAPIAYFLGFPDIAHSIYSLGFPNYVFAKPHLGLEIQDERFRPIQEIIAGVSARASVRAEIIMNSIKPKKNKDKTAA